MKKTDRSCYLFCLNSSKAENTNLITLFNSITYAVKIVYLTIIKTKAKQVIAQHK